MRRFPTTQVHELQMRELTGMVRTDTEEDVVR